MSKHIELEHAGTQTLMSYLRDYYWIIKTRRIVRGVIRKVLGRACLNDEELATVLCDAESLINSRPLTYFSEDPDDLLAITPSAFLQKIRNIGVPDLDAVDSKKLRKRYAYRLKLRQDLRNRFRSEYLGLLKDYSKVRKDCMIKEGDLVLIGDANNKRINWPLAKVVKIFPGKDGRIRVVELKTQLRRLLRPIQKLYRLEVSTSERVQRALVARVFSFGVQKRFSAFGVHRERGQKVALFALSAHTFYTDRRFGASADVHDS